MKKTRAWFMRLSIGKQMWWSMLFVSLTGAVLALAFFPLARYAAVGWVWGVLTVSGVFGLILLLNYRLLRWRGQRLLTSLASVGIVYFGLLFVAFSFVMLIVINSLSIANTAWLPRLSTLTEGPINFFGYLVGVAAVPVVAITLGIINRKR